LEIKQANGTWTLAPQSAQIPLPSDSNPRTFVVDLTGLFPKGLTDYQVRFTNVWNVTFSYIGIDTSAQQPTTITTLKPSSAVLSQFWETNSSSSGNFTKYGDVTSLLQSADDMYVIGRQGDQVQMQFSTENLPPLAPGMVRDYFFEVACWFKDPPGQWGYDFNFSVNPLPFMAMTGFPYPSNESYPYDAAHLAYLSQYNTRVIPPPATTTTPSQSAIAPPNTSILLLASLAVFAFYSYGASTKQLTLAIKKFQKTIFFRHS
jgi:hypothetical protein